MWCCVVKAEQDFGWDQSQWEICRPCQNGTASHPSQWCVRCMAEIEKSCQGDSDVKMAMLNWQKAALKSSDLRMYVTSFKAACGPGTVHDCSDLMKSWQLCPVNYSFDRSCVLQIRKGNSLWLLMSVIPTFPPWNVGTCCIVSVGRINSTPRSVLSRTGLHGEWGVENKDSKIRKSCTKNHSFST